MNLNQRVTEAREFAGLTKVELARRSGVTKQAIGQIESGETHSPKPDNLFKIAKATGTRAEWIVTGEEPMEALVELRESLSTDGQSAFLEKADHFIREPGSLSYTLSATEKDVLERVEKLIKKDPKNLDEITNFITFLEHKSKD